MPGYKTKRFIVGALMAVPLVIMTLNAAVETEMIPGFNAVSAAADIARQKDIIWLSLVTTIIAIAFCAWLVRQMMAQSKETFEAMVRQANETAKALELIRDRIQIMPCQFDNKRHDKP